MMKPVAFERTDFKVLYQCYISWFPYTWYQMQDKTETMPSHPTFTMARLNIQERIFIVETMTLTKSATATGRKFNAKFGHKVTLKTIMRIIKKWKDLGAVQDCHKGNSGRKKSARSPENQEKVKSLVQSNSKTSVRKISAASCLKKSSVHRILKRDLCLKPYKPQISQELKEGDDIKRLEFCNKIQEMIQDNEFAQEISFLPTNRMFTCKTLQINRIIVNGDWQDPKTEHLCLFTQLKLPFGAGWIQPRFLARFFPRFWNWLSGYCNKRALHTNVNGDFPRRLRGGQ